MEVLKNVVKKGLGQFREKFLVSKKNYEFAGTLVEVLHHVKLKVAGKETGFFVIKNPVDQKFYAMGYEGVHISLSGHDDIFAATKEGLMWCGLIKYWAEQEKHFVVFNFRREREKYESETFGFAVTEPEKEQENESDNEN